MKSEKRKNNVEAPVGTSTYLCSGVDTLTSGALANAECTKTNESNLVTCYESVLNSCDCGFKSLLRVYL